MAELKPTTGAAYTVPSNVKGSGAVNNRGVATRTGSSASGKLSNVTVSRYNAGVFGSTVIDNSWVDKALSAGTFLSNTQRPIGIRVTSTLAGVANTLLRSGADTPAFFRSIHKREVYRTQLYTTAIRAGAWNMVTAKWTSGMAGISGAGYVSGITDSYSSDVAANPSRSVPGRLVFKGGAINPVTKNYAAKTG